MHETTALHTDQYELTAVRSALSSKVALRQAVFEVFARSLPMGRRYGTFCGVGRLIEALGNFHFGDDELDFLAQRGVIDTELLSYLDGWRFNGTVSAYSEGEPYFPFSPVLRIEGTFAEACIVETLVLSILNHDTAIASAASRMVSAANGRSLVEMGGRRTHEEAALAVARAAYIAGFTATSNLEAGRRYGIPTVGTAMHAFTLAHDDELSAFRAQVATLGVTTTLLVDTYDIEDGIRHAVQAAQEVGATGPGAIRIDSGILHEEVGKARHLLDELGAVGTKITVTSDLDEFAIRDLAASAVDSYGVGTKLVTGSGAPTAGFVYKLVAIEDGDTMRPVAKRSASKVSIGGRKVPYRVIEGHRATAECFSIDGRLPSSVRALQHTVMIDGYPVMATPLSVLRDHAARALAELPPDATVVDPGDPIFFASRADEEDNHLVGIA